MILTINGKIYEAHEKKSGKNFTKNRKETARQQRKKWNKANMQTVSACMRKEDVQEFSSDILPLSISSGLLNPCSLYTSLTVSPCILGTDKHPPPQIGDAPTRAEHEGLYCCRI